MNTVAASWTAFRATYIPPTAPEVQVREMRRAFYAGVEALFDEFMRLPETGGEPTDAEMERMAGIQAELDAFVRALWRGKA